MQTEYANAKQSDTPWEFWDWLKDNYNPAKTSTLRLLFLDPEILSAVISTGDLQLIAKHFREFDGLVALRRSRDSQLPLGVGPAAGKLSLEKIMPESTRNTVTLKHGTAAEEGEYLAHHRVYSRQVHCTFMIGEPLLTSDRDYNEICKEWAKKTGVKGRKRSGDLMTPPPVTAPLRMMAIATFSTKLSRFARWFTTRTDGDTNIESVNKWRKLGLNVDTFLCMVESTQDLPRSRAAKLRLLVEGSPKLEFILKDISNNVIPGKKDQMSWRKLLVTEQFPIIAWYLELVLNYLHIPTQVLHSGLDTGEREKVVKDFKQPAHAGGLHHLAICILMYTINAAGVNLDTDCRRAIVNTAASSPALEVQTWSRIIRVS